MAELNLKQITDKLNSEFASDVRKLVFWYDANAEFQEDIDSIELENAKVLHLEPDNQFYIKYFLEREDTTTNYLVYAPFAKPSIRDNHLADTIRYSKEFFADRASLLTLDLGIDERYKPVIQHYIKFFANKDRTQKFYDLKIENFNRSTIEVALMSVLCKDKTASFEEVLRSILTDDGLLDNKYLTEFEKYDLLSAFWQQADVAFGYNDPKPTLEKLVITMFITYAAKSIHTDMPQAWKPFISYKFGNIIAFMDNLMNSYLYGTRFDEISEIIYNAINGKNYLEKMEVETLVDCNIFAGVDELLISWIIGRLENEDIGAKLNGKTIPELCVERRKQHFGKNFRSEYFILQNAFDMVAEGKYQPVSGIKNLVKEYTESTYKIDRYYRYFYFYFDKLEDTTQFEKIRELVENIYTNEYLNRITVNWNNELADTDGETGLASDIFKVAGAGQNYVHGGCSPQEMLVPMIDVKVDKGKKETSLAEIALVSLTSKITNLITTLDFVQTEPVSDVVKETSYRVYFISDSNEKISNENIVIADKKDKDTTKRMFRLRFNFKNKKYDKSQKYYLVAYDDKNDIEVLRHEIIMDIAFADDFGFFG